MNIEELLLPEEKKRIKEISEAQKSILERRESIKIILNGGSIKNSIKGTSTKSNINNANAYRLFLQKEGFFIKEENTKKENNSKSIEYTKNNKVFYNICSKMYVETNGLYLELYSGLSNINKIEEIISLLGTIERKLVLCKVCKNLDYNIKERYKGLIYNLSKLIKLLSESKGDIVDYYSNKTDILKLLKIIVNSSKNLMNTL